MASKHTERFGLCQWEAEDQVLRSDFNADNAKVEAALALCPRIAVGSYEGTGTYGQANPNSLTFDFAPKLVVITRNAVGSSGQGTVLVGGQTKSSGIGHSSSNSLSLYLTWEGNTVSWYTADVSGGGSASDQFNINGGIYHYCALGL